MLLLDNTVQTYAWGARDGLADLVGSVPSGGPEAELWIGAHPLAPSRLAQDPERTLADVVAADPEAALGPDLAAEVGPRLPFLLKVLAIGAPLSVQAHPSADQARAGFSAEEEAGTPLTAPHRTYRDPYRKPELLVALVDTWALCGFRPPAEALELVDRLGVAALEPLSEALGIGGPDGTRAALSWVLQLDDGARDRVAGAAAAAALGLAGEDGGRASPYTWVAHLAAEHPGDPGCISPLLLNLLRLAPGDRVHLPAGYLHAYLEGAGVEVMAASDNVLRGGLTSKHIDVPELLRSLRFDAGLPDDPDPVDEAPGVRSYDVGEEAFALTRLVPSEAGGSIDLGRIGPALLLATGGTAKVHGDHEALGLAAGRAAFVAAADGPVRVEGDGTVWLARPGRAPFA